MTVWNKARSIGGAAFVGVVGCSTPSGSISIPDATPVEVGTRPTRDASGDTGTVASRDAAQNDASPHDSGLKDAGSHEGGSYDAASHDAMVEATVMTGLDSGSDSGSGPDASAVCVFDNPLSTFDGKCLFGP